MNRFAVIAACAVMLCSGGAAHALSQYSVSSNVLPLSTTDFTRSLELAKFDPGLGTLMKVTTFVQLDLLGSLFGENFGSLDAYYEATMRTTAAVRLSDLRDLVTTVAEYSAQLEVGRYDGVFDYAGTSGGLVSGMSSASNTSSTMSLGDLALFTGPDPLSLTFKTRTSVFFSFSGSGSVGTSLKAGGYVTATYFYAVPEPASWAMMIVGFASVGGAMRRRVMIAV